MPIEITDTKALSELDDLAGQIVDGDDYFLIFDLSTGKSCKIKRGTLLGKALPLANYGSLTGLPYATSGTFSNIGIGAGLTVISGNLKTNLTLSELPSITGSSVLGRATITGTPAAITATGANQVLVVSSSGSLAFGSISDSNLVAGTAIANINRGSATISGSYIGGSANTISGSYIKGDAKIGASALAANAVTTTKILDGNVTLAKIQNMPQSTLLGRLTGSTGAIGAITVGGGLAISTAGSMVVNHDNTSGFVANEHIDHTGVTINTSGTGLTGGGFNLTAGTKTITLTSASAPTAANTIARTGADNYLNGMVKDLVYIQLFPLLETIVASPTTPLAQFFIPSVCANKSIKKIGLATWEQVGTGEGLTLTVKNESGTSVGTVSLIPLQYTAESSVNYSLSGHSRIVFYMTSVTGTITGADAWLELG